MRGARNRKGGVNTPRAMAEVLEARRLLSMYVWVEPPGSVEVPVGEGGQFTFYLHLFRDGASPFPTISWQVSGQGASEGEDYSVSPASSGTVEIPSPYYPNHYVQGVTVQVLPDNLVEDAPERFQIEITAAESECILWPYGVPPYAPLPPQNYGLAVILDDPPIVNISTVDGTGAETDAGQPADGARLMVTRTGGDTETPIAVSLSYSGTATRGSDYTSSAGTTVSVLTSATVDLAIINDEIEENPETIIATLQPGGDTYKVRAGYGTASAMVLDNDSTPKPTVSIAPYDGTQQAEGTEEFDPATGQPQPLRFLVSRAGADVSQPLTISYSVEGSGSDPADSGDWSSSGSSVTIPGGSLSTILEIGVTDDEEVEALWEGLIVTLTGGGLGAPYVLGAAVADGAIRDNDWEISSAAVSFNDQGITYDPQSVYTTTEWYDHDGDGSPSTDAGEAQPAPISYWRSIPGQAHQITATPWFALRGNPMPGLYHIKGTGSGPGGGTFEGDVALTHADSFVYTWYVSGSFTSSENLPEVIKKGDLQISWEVKRVGPQPQTRSYGSSENTIYVTGASAPNARETVIDIGCRSGAAGANLEAPNATESILCGIWSEFAGLQTTNAAGRPLMYWGPKATQTGIFDTAGLIANEDGRCGAWAALFVDVLRAQGVGAAISRIIVDSAVVIPRMPQVVPPPGTLTGSLFFDVKASLPGQNNPSPPTLFADHDVVKIAGRNEVYDPSYGMLYQADSVAAAEQMWQDASIATFRYAFWSGQPFRSDFLGTSNECIAHLLGVDEMGFQ